jgi:transcriptional regulator of heat shock response
MTEIPAGARVMEFDPSKVYLILVSNKTMIESDAVDLAVKLGAQNIRAVCRIVKHDINGVKALERGTIQDGHQ